MLPKAEVSSKLSSSLTFSITTWVGTISRTYNFLALQDFCYDQVKIVTNYWNRNGSPAAPQEF